MFSNTIKILISSSYQSSMLTTQYNYLEPLVLKLSLQDINSHSGKYRLITIQKTQKLPEFLGECFLRYY